MSSPDEVGLTGKRAALDGNCVHCRTQRPPRQVSTAIWLLMELERYDTFVAAIFQAEIRPNSMTSAIHRNAMCGVIV